MSAYELDYRDSGSAPSAVPRLTSPGTTKEFDGSVFVKVPKLIITLEVLESWKISEYLSIF